MPNYYIAIDGGGTKTDVVLFDDAGQVVNRAIGKSTSPSALTDGELHSHFTAIFEQLLSIQKPAKITRCFAGMSGADHPILNDRLKKVIKDTLSIPCDDIRIENDAVTALWSGTDGSPGVVVIAGTGSIAYGRRANGTNFRIGGWGHLVGDDGSGYYIGKEAVRAAFRVHDGMEQPTPLYEKVKQHFGISVMPDAIPIVYGSSKTTLSSMAPLVVESASVGDTTAIRILKDAAHYLSELIQSGLSHFNDNDIPVVLVGGLWRSELIRQEATERFNQTFILPTLPPVYGSIVGALGSDNPDTLASLKRYFLKE